MKTNAKTLNFEASLSELEAMVADLKSGHLSLEESLNLFAKGVKLAKTCQKSLHAAELKVNKLVQENQELTSTSLDFPDAE